MRGPGQLFDLMCFPDDLSVFTPHSLQSAEDRARTLTVRTLCFECHGIRMFVLAYLKLIVFVLSSASPSLPLHATPFLCSLLLPSSRQNQLKDQAQQALVSPSQLPEEAECLTVPKYKRDLVQKLKILRQELSQQQPQAGHCRVEVSREEIFEVRMERNKLSHVVISSDAHKRCLLLKALRERCII